MKNGVLVSAYSRFALLNIVYLEKDFHVQGHVLNFINLIAIMSLMNLWCL